MRRTARTLLATLGLGLMMTLSTAVASAGWDWWDCPPAAMAGQSHMSGKAVSQVKDVHPPAAPAAWNAPSK